MNHINSFTVSLQEALLFSWMSLSMALLTNNNPVRAVAHVRGFWGKPPGKFFYFFFWPQPGVQSPETEMWHGCFSFSAVSEMWSWCLTQRSLLWPHSHGSKNCLMTPSNFKPQKGKRVYCEWLLAWHWLQSSTWCCTENLLVVSLVASRLPQSPTCLQMLAITKFS